MNEASTDLVTVFRCTLSEALSLEAALWLRGFHPIIASQFIKIFNPFITGGNIFHVDVQTPAWEARDASEEIRALRDHAREGGGKEESIQRTEKPRFLALEASGRRLRWSSLLVWFSLSNPVSGAVIFLVYSALVFRYCARVKSAGVSPPGHWLTLGSFAFVASLVGTLAVLILSS